MSQYFSPPGLHCPLDLNGVNVENTIYKRVKKNISKNIEVVYFIKGN